ncbi:polysaccharide deacetylase family protein [Kitasatospora sp. NPDC050543]|uniref:polysaccharide deacetylase family protein n=1 Tax=Kitasatospora sp. NPDC050543 TaxID=3364054 RepID=UPI0037BD01FA
MTVSRRAVLAAVAGGAVAGGAAGCAPQQTVGPGSAAGPTVHQATATPAPTADTASTATATAPADRTASATETAAAAEAAAVPPAAPVTREQVLLRFGELAPEGWGFDAPGVVGALPTAEPAIALTFDACGGPDGSGYDEALLDFLRAHRVPATLFLNARWLDANPGPFGELAADPLFEIGNHGTLHRPLSVSGRSAYGIPGTRDAGEVFDEVAGNRDRLTGLLGHPPRFFRAGTAYYDDVAARIVTALGARIAGFTVNGDGGATFTADQVNETVAGAGPGSIVLCHMNHPGGGTALGVAAAVPQLLDAGGHFVRLSDLVR